MPAGTNGEILIRAPSLTAGYWDDPQTTSRQIVDGWLHTGDMGHLDADGFLYIVGRKGDMIISGGMNVFPSEIESVLLEHPAVADVAVIGLPDDRWGEIVCAVIEPLPGAVVDEAEHHRLLHGADRRLQEAVRGAGRRLAPAHGGRQAAQVRAAGALRRSAGRHRAPRTIG